jgi:tRNA(fMet)-specific endonuclease VapC
MLDTNTCIYLLNGRHPDVARKVAAVPSSEIAVSSVVWFELMFGAAKSSKRAEAELRLRTFARQIEVVPMDAAASEAAAVVRARLEEKGTPIGSFDTLIAGHAVATKTTLVTHNTREFKRVKGLHLTDWVGGAT